MHAHTHISLNTGFHHSTTFRSRQPYWSPYLTVWQRFCFRFCSTSILTFDPEASTDLISCELCNAALNPSESVIWAQRKSV